MASTAQQDRPDISAWFLGPKAEHAEAFEKAVHFVLTDYVNWRRNFFPSDPTVISRERRREHEAFNDRLYDELETILDRLKADFPFFHPRYIAHMVSGQLAPAVLGLIAGVLYNPNNVSEEAAPVTVNLELEVGRMVGQMLGFDPGRLWSHLTSGGTVANIEALWGARTTQFTPLALQDLCRDRKLDFEVQLPGSSGATASLGGADPAQLVALRPHVALRVPRALTAYLVTERSTDPEVAVEMVTTAIEESPWNVVKRGYHSVASRLGKRPVVFAPATAHYSIKKACALLGYGQDALHLVPITTRFRQDLDALDSMLHGLEDDQYVAFAMGVAGTSEEGAVDPIHELLALRDRYSDATGKAYWLHADCAWGGYAASIVRGHPDHGSKAGDPIAHAGAMAETIDARHVISVTCDDGAVVEEEVFWGRPDVIRAYLAIGQADSATIDAHKQGYIPYPAGVVVFAEGLITEVITEKANVTFEPEQRTFRPVEEPPVIEAVGPYILEGSKPGSMALACWLAHKTVPLTIDGHGQIIRETVVACAQLARYFELHRRLFATFEAADGVTEDHGEAFTFMPLYEPDLNILCWIARPMGRAGDGLVETEVSLERLNLINEQIYRQAGEMTTVAGETMPYGHPAFVSRTKLEHTEYTAESMRDVLERLGAPAEEYEREGLFVLRSVVMNPFYRLAEDEAGKDYLFDYVRDMHRTVRQILRVLSPDRAAV